MSQNLLEGEILRPLRIASCKKNQGRVPPTPDKTAQLIFHNGA